MTWFKEINSSQKSVCLLLFCGGLYAKAMHLFFLDNVIFGQVILEFFPSTYCLLSWICTTSPPPMVWPCTFRWRPRFPRCFSLSDGFKNFFTLHHVPFALRLSVRLKRLRNATLHSGKEQFMLSTKDFLIYRKYLLVNHLRHYLFPCVVTLLYLYIKSPRFASIFYSGLWQLLHIDMTTFRNFTYLDSDDQLCLLCWFIVISVLSMASLDIPAIITGWNVTLKTYVAWQKHIIIITIRNFCFI